MCASAAVIFLHGRQGTFRECPACQLVFRDPGEHLDAAAADARYREHRNFLDDPRYLAFLDRLGAPVAQRLPPGARGLDYGCGPVHGIATLMEPRGFPMASWDPLFHPDDGPLRETYDFVTCSEVLEHVADPREALDRLAALLHPGGLLAIMTQFRGDAAHFTGWHYHRDPTHVCFYSPDTMRWIAEQRGWRVELPADGITLFTLPRGA